MKARTKTDYGLFIPLLGLLGAAGIMVFGIMPDARRAHATLSHASPCVPQVYEEECDSD